MDNKELIKLLKSINKITVDEKVVYCKSKEKLYDE